MHPRKSPLALILFILLVCAGLLALWTTSQSSPLMPQPAANDSRIPLAILGDSDSHSYHDTLNFPPGSPDRGGRYRDQTWQWGEVLAQLRGSEIDLGPWGSWGTRRVVARLQEALGMSGRNPRKMDYRYNFAQSGAVCDDLDQGQMTRQLVELMDQNPDRWRRGVVVIRIGVNDVGTRKDLAVWAQNGQDPALMAKVDNCVKQYRNAVQTIHHAHPDTRIVLVGLFDNSNWAPLTDKWQDAQSMRNIAMGLAAFNAPLKQLAQSDKRLTFFDDQAWFRHTWGARTPDGKPDYKRVTIDGRWPTPNTQGDSPDHATVQDGHAGTIWNLKWAQSLINQINVAFNLKLTPLTDQDMAQFLNDKGIQPW
ncbi:MAG TPA: SGNH/GDSL hydrolase family protein [Aquabacterium sp.]|nr:SGNH/GDSL hydrolase family protein [Aquabacterium sp.]